jgi:hypothetical protein
MKSVDYSKSLEQIEKDYREPSTYDSYVVTTCHNMRKKPLKELTIEEIRLVVGLGISLEILMPIAIEKLKENILAEGDLFEGDLLNNVMSKNTFEYWRKHEDRWGEVVNLYLKNIDIFESDNSFRQIRKSFEEFQTIGNLLT